jgi:hypothetical protein
MHLPEPFKLSTFQQAAAAGCTAPPAANVPAGDVVPAPWSVVCLAAMLHRFDPAPLPGAGFRSSSSPACTPLASAP